VGKGWTRKVNAVAAVERCAENGKDCMSEVDSSRRRRDSWGSSKDEKRSQGFRDSVGGHQKYMKQSYKGEGVICGACGIRQKAGRAFKGGKGEEQRLLKLQKKGAEKATSAKGWRISGKKKQGGERVLGKSLLKKVGNKKLGRKEKLSKPVFRLNGKEEKSSLRKRDVVYGQSAEERSMETSCYGKVLPVR